MKKSISLCNLYRIFPPSSKSSISREVQDLVRSSVSLSPKEKTKISAEVEQFLDSITREASNDSIYDYYIQEIKVPSMDAAKRPAFTSLPQNRRKPASKAKAPRKSNYQRIKKIRKTTPQKSRMTWLLILIVPTAFLMGLFLQAMLPVSQASKSPKLSPGKSPEPPQKVIQKVDLQKEIPTPITAKQITVRGRVISVDGHGIPRAFLTAKHLQHQKETIVVSNAQGFFELLLPKGEAWQLKVEASGFQEWEKRLPVTNVDNLEIKLQKTTRIIVKVEYPDTLVRGLQIIARSATEEGIIITAFPDKQRHFILDTEPGEYALYFAYHGYHWPVQEQVWVRQGQQVIAKMSPPLFGSLKGILRSSGTVKKARAVLFHMAKDLKTESLISISSGEFTMQNLPPGPYNLELTTSHIASKINAEILIHPGQETVVDLSCPQAMLEGYLKGLSSDAQVNLNKIVTGDDASYLERIAHQVTSPAQNGHFKFEGLEEGQYLIFAETTTGQASANLSIQPAGSHFIDLQLTDYQNCTVKVLHNNTPISGARVYTFRQPYRDISRTTLTDHMGIGVLEKLSQGTYQILVRARVPSLPNSALRQTKLIEVSSSAPCGRDCQAGVEGLKICG